MLRSSEVQEFMSSGIEEFRNSGEFWNSGFLENSGILEFCNSGILKFWNSGILEFWRRRRRRRHAEPC